ncbi:hypothetical protein [Falsiroseomonas sp.]|uniref:hypothetical protein n=1 Tax=Falsiroseomonas sp. TaxID=2870721 RepID=UPI003F6F773F
MDERSTPEAATPSACEWALAIAFAHQHDASFPRRPRSTHQQLAAYAGSRGLVEARQMLPGLLRLPRHLREALAAALLADGHPLHPLDAEGSPR